MDVTRCGTEWMGFKIRMVSAGEIWVTMGCDGIF